MSDFPRALRRTVRARGAEHFVPREYDIDTLRVVRVVTVNGWRHLAELRVVGADGGGCD